MSFWKKIKGLIAPTSDEKQDEGDFELVDFKKKDPTDVAFTKNFVLGGGMFFYCENEQEALENLKDIVENEQIDSVICFKRELQSFLNRLNVKYVSDYQEEIPFAFIDCEFLVGSDGSIVLSPSQTKGRNHDKLPASFIVMAKTNQFAETLNEAFHKLKTTKGGVHTTFTSIRGSNMHDFDASPTAKKIYLLLVEG